MKFSYSQYPGPDGKLLYRPSIPITLKVGKATINVEALIDSGADLTLLPIEFAGFFGFRLDNQPKLPIQGAGSNIFFIYRSPVKIEHMIQAKGFRDLRWKSFVYFAESQPTILLGQKGFFDHVQVTMNGKAHEIELESL